MEGACDTNAAELLLGLSSDAYFEVRRRAIAALEKVVRCTEPVLAASWLQRRYHALRKRAGNGPLLLPLALVQWLMGRNEAALQSLLAYYAGAEHPDPVALAMGARLARSLGLERQALLLLRDFTAAAHTNFTERKEAWSSGSINKRSSGGMTLLQVCGLVRLWEETLGLFDGMRVAGGGLGGGSWLDDSRAKYERARQWTEATDQAWQPAHPGWPGCRQDNKVARPEDEITDAVRRIVWFPRAWTEPMANWLACCHPVEHLRDLARGLVEQRKITEHAGFVLPVWNLTSPPALYKSETAGPSSDW
ncbi:MAG: hypothetical protein D6806_10740 [Deltaproteobacteria bacterium]|nr:MAG: hypothetical protein D6806_10740 [Deltaproteobacteria bacterium]